MATPGCGGSLPSPLTEQLQLREWGPRPRPPWAALPRAPCTPRLSLPGTRRQGAWLCREVRPARGRTVGGQTAPLRTLWPSPGPLLGDLTLLSAARPQGSTWAAGREAGSQVASGSSRRPVCRLRGGPCPKHVCAAAAWPPAIVALAAPAEGLGKPLLTSLHGRRRPRGPIWSLSLNGLVFPRGRLSSLQISLLISKWPRQRGLFCFSCPRCGSRAG